MTPEQRARAVADRFACELPTCSVPELERIVTSAIKRALGQQLAELEAWANRSSEYAMGRGKNGKGRDESAVRVHDEWAIRFRRFRNAHIR
ncbi:MAG: hypothetical protein ACREXY_20745 [Gammaproteobacteria bacterium]